MNPWLERLRPHPHRGDVIAAGAVPLALAAFLIEGRMSQWGLGPRFIVVGAIAGMLLTMGWLAPLESDAPRPYHSVLLVAGLLPLITTLVLLAEILGAHRPPGAGGLFWIYGSLAAVAAACARCANSGVCTLIAAVASLVAVEAFVYWAFHPHGIGTFRAMLVVLTLAFGAGALRLREPRRRHAVQLVNASGIASLVLGVTFLVASALASALQFDSGFALAGASGVGFGWKLYLLAVGFGLIAYAAVDREPAPAYFGGVILLLFVALAVATPNGRGSLLGWPLFLLVVGVAGLAIGLRPRHPLPPSPAPAPAPTVPFDPGAQR